MTELPENETEMGILPSERIDEIAQYLAAIVDSSDDAILSKDLHGTITSWNRGAERLFGYTFAETVGKSIRMLVPSDRHREESAILERVGRGERVEHYETVRTSRDGSAIEISLTVSPVRNADGQIIGASSIARDISRRKRREAQLGALAREAEHRAKNVLSVVQAIVQLSRAGTPDELKLVIEGRIRALASVVSLFAESRWSGAELHTLVTQELAAYGLLGSGPCRLNGPKLMLAPDRAQPLAMVIHELAMPRSTAHYQHPMVALTLNCRELRTIKLSFDGPRQTAQLLSRLSGEDLAPN